MVRDLRGEERDTLAVELEVQDGVALEEGEEVM
jgi:hypothetical protein